MDLGIRGKKALVNGGSAHAFTRPDANYAAGGIMYSPVADRRSWEAATRFLAEVL